MTGIQIGFITFTFLSPPLLWLLSRAVESPRLARGINWSLAALLVVAYAAALWLKNEGDGSLLFDTALPMHLCDWAALATLIALTRGNSTAFELAYCWGLAGTLQALFTPAIGTDATARVFFFFCIHSLIPAGVIWLMLEFKHRPRPGAWWRVMLWSEIYLITALLVNKFTGGNYGFLASRPSTRSMLDMFSDTHWLYVAQINLTACVVFALLLLPWQLARRRGTADA